MNMIGQHEDNFLLHSETACILYHDYAETMPILDYHCHNDPKEIFEDRKYDSITQVWLGGDHYKWRVMRTNGVPEKYITGDADDWEKFQKWAETLTKCVGNPLYHWSYLELKRYFGFDGVLTPENAREVYELCNEQLRNGLTVRELITRAGVEVICTTDDPVDSLCWHKKLAEDKSFPVKVYPTFRPDKITQIEKSEFCGYVAKLSEVSGIAVTDFESLCAALENRIDYFTRFGCKISDHALENCVCVPAAKEECSAILKKRLSGEALSVLEIEQFKTETLAFLAGIYREKNWVMQIHYGCIRNNNSKMFAKLGPDTGYDAIMQGMNAEKLSAFLDLLYATDRMPKIILYPLDSNEYHMIMTMIACFQGEGAASKLQLGSGWWFNDTKMGMEKQLSVFAEQGVLGNFVGMLTDSRSFLSYTRHEYFRRILCNWLGALKESGECVESIEALGKMVQDISYGNADRYFGFNK